MRAKDFINDDAFDKGSFIEKPILNGKYLLKGRAKEKLDGSTVFLITVYDPANPKNAGEMAKEFGMDGIAGFRFVKKKNGGVASADTYVDKDYQRQGIASAVYKFVKSLGYDVQPSAMQSPDGKAMWQSFRDKGVIEENEQKMSVKDTLAYLKKVMGTESHEDWRNDVINNNQYFVLKDIPLKSLWIDLPMLDKANVEKYKKMDFSKAPPIVVGSDGHIIDGYHRANVAKALNVPKLKAWVGIKKQGMTEAPLPPDWDPEKVNLRQTYKDRIKYVVDRAKRIGGGSSRVAVTIEHEGRPTVLKVAKNYKGLAQNEAEISILNDGYFSKLPIVIPLIDYDKENSRPVWLQTEVAKKVTAPTLMKLLHTPSLWLFNNKVRNILGRRKPHEIDDATIKRKYFETYNERWKPTEQDWDIFEEYANEVADLVGNSSLELGDLNSASNWGVYNGRPVIIDLGLSSEVWQKYYVQGRYRKNK